jgi:hypothetical protein
LSPLTPASAADDPTNEVDSEIAKWQEEARRKFVTFRLVINPAIADQAISFWKKNN